MIGLSDSTPTLSGATVTIQPASMAIGFGTAPCTALSSAATASVTTMSGGTGVGKLYIASTCTLVLQYPNSLTVTWALAGMTAQPVATPAVPDDAIYVADVAIGPSAVTSVSDKRSFWRKDSTKAGSGIVQDCTLGPCLLSTDPAIVPTLGGVNPYTGTQDSTGASVTKPSRTVSSDPSGSCPQNNELILSTSSGNPFSCLAGTWHAIAGGGGSAPVLHLGGLALGDEDPASSVLTTAKYTNHGFIISAGATTLTEASCISDTGDQTVLVKIGATTMFSIHCVAPGSYSAATTTGTTGYMNAAAMTNTAVGAHAMLDLSGTTNSTTKGIVLHIYGQ